MTRRARMGTLALGLAALVLSPRLPGQESDRLPIHLRHQWPVGKVITHQASVRQEVEFTTADGGTPYFQDLEQKVTFTVTHLPPTAPDEQARLALRITAVEASVRAPGAAWSFDSQRPAPEEGNPLAGLARAVNRTVTYTVGPTGEVRVVSGVMGASSTPAEAMREMEALRSLRQMLEDAQAGLPAEPVRPGDRWTYVRRRNLPGFGVLLAEHTAAYDGREQRAGREIARLRQEARLSNEARDAWTDDGAGGRVRLSGVAGTLTGTLEFDTALGQSRAASFLQEFQADVVTRKDGAESRARAKVRIQSRDEIRSVADWTP